MKALKRKTATNFYLALVTIMFLVANPVGKQLFAQTSAKYPSSIDGFWDSEEVKKEIVNRREAWRKTIESKNVDETMKFYVPDILSYDLMAPLQFDGTPMWRQNWINFYNMFEGDIKLTLQDLTVFQSGNLATIRALTRLQGKTVDGQPTDMWCRETNVFRKINGQWMLVHDHVSVPMDFKTGKALTTLKPAARQK